MAENSLRKISKQHSLQSIQPMHENSQIKQPLTQTKPQNPAIIQPSKHPRNPRNPAIESPKINIY
jgi:hypothetical protein